jgi:hypothetical protein
MGWWVWWWAGCEPAPEEGGPPPEPEDTGCLARPWFEDRDGDGVGGAALGESCDAPAGAAPEGGDCDDADPTARPGAAEACDGRDQDCDGAPAPEELDIDGDGLSTCAGDCDDADPAAFPGGQEVCGGGDEDCDGLADLDDDSVDLYSCGWCPDESTAPTFTFDTRTLNPCVLDPTVSMCSQIPWLPDTHESGNRLHRILWRTDGVPLRDELMLYLPPGAGDHNNRVLAWAAFAGYRTVALGWQNEPLVNNCVDSACYDEVRWEMLYGEDTSPYLEIWPSDSVIGRIDTLFAHLVAAYPTEGWDRYWDPVDGLRWERVVVFGWSDGCNEAAYLGRFHPSRSQVLVSGPADLTSDNQGADWISEPRAVETCRQWGMYHRQEPGSGYDTGGPDLLSMSLARLGIEGSPVDVDTVPPPYGGARILNTEKTNYLADWCNPHQAMAMDECLSPDLNEMYLYAFCSAGDPGACDGG